MNGICPNLNDPKVRAEFEELKEVLGENAAYHVWDQNNGYSLDYAPNGEQSKLFTELLNYYKKDRKKAILAKANTFTQSFKTWFGQSKVVDENGEPLVVWHGTNQAFDTFSKDKRGENTGIVEYNNEVLSDSQNAWFFTDFKNVAVNYSFLALDAKRYEVLKLIEDVISSMNSGQEFNKTNHDNKTRFRDKVERLKKVSPKLMNILSQLPERLNMWSEDQIKSFVKNQLVPVRELFVDPQVSRKLTNKYNFIHRCRNNYNELYYHFSDLSKNDDTSSKFDLSERNYNLSEGCWIFQDDDKRIGIVLPDRGRVMLDTIISESDKIDLLSQIKSNIKSLTRQFNQSLEDFGFVGNVILYPCFLRMQNPLSHDYNYSAFPDFYQVITDENDPKAIRTYDKNDNEVLVRKTKYTTSYIAARQVKKALMDGHDGVIYDNISDPMLSTNYGVFDGNQIKSIDNNGQFLLNDDNIYHYIADHIDASTNSSYYAGKQAIGQLFSQRIESAKDVLQRMINNDGFLEDGQVVLASKLLEKLSEEVRVQLVNNVGYSMSYQDSIIRINVDSFNSHNRFDVGNRFLHELLHHFTVTRYKNDSKFKKLIDDFFNKVSEQFPKSKYARTGLYYGLTKPEEMIAEMYTNQAFRDAVLKKNMSWWRNMLFDTLKALNLNKTARRIQPNTVTKVLNAITDAINNRMLDPTLTETGQELFYTSYRTFDEIEKDAKKIITKMMRGLKASERFLKAQKKSPTQITRLQHQISQYQTMIDNAENQAVIIDFVKSASIQFSNTLAYLRKVHNSGGRLSLTDDELRNLRVNPLDFYSMVIDEISVNVVDSSFFNQQQLQFLEHQISLIKQASDSCRSLYNSMLRSRVIELFRQKGQQYGIPTEDIEAFINDKLCNVCKDTNSFLRLFQFASGANDLGIRIMNRLMSDINNQVGYTSNIKTQEIIRELSQLSQSDLLKFYEVDENGKPTGYLVRDLNYGRFRRDMKEFLKELDEEYGVIAGDYFALSDSEFKEYCNEKEDWLAQHCTRRFIPEYYRRYANLSKLTKNAMRLYNDNINAIVADVTDGDGVHLERLTDSSWARLNQLMIQKRNLSNRYYTDGNLKQGDDIAIATELMEFYENLGDNSIKSKVLTQQQLADLMQRKQRELSKQDYDKWVQRSISVQFTEEFTELLKRFGRPHVKITSSTNMNNLSQYDILYDERSELLRQGRSLNTPMYIVDFYTEEVKSKILELDEQLYQLNQGNQVDEEFYDYVDFLETPYYKRDHNEALQEARQKGIKLSNTDWFRKNHYQDNKGRWRRASYYTMIYPKDPSKYVENRLSRFSQEIDPDSPLVDPNYNFKDPQYYQPKRRLYDNTQKYKNATRTPMQQQVYEYIQNVIRETYEKISYLDRFDPFTLPQATGDFIDFTLRNGNFFKNFVRMVKDAITVKNDDPQYAQDNILTKANGEELNFIPTHYIKLLEHPETISRNLIGLLSEFYRMGESFRLKSKYANTFEIVLDMYADRSFADISKDGTIRKDIPGTQANTTRQLRKYADLQLYNKGQKPWNVDVNLFGKTYTFSISKLLTHLRKYASASNLSNNLTALMKSVFQSYDKMFVEGFAGQFYNMQDIGRATARMLMRMPFKIWNMGNPKENDLQLALLEHNQIAHDIQNKTDALQYNRAFRFLHKYFIWGGWQAADFMIKTPIVEAVYSNVRYIPEEDKFMTLPQYCRLHPDMTYAECNKQFRKNKDTFLNMFEAKDGKLKIKDNVDPVLADAARRKDINLLVTNICKTLCSRIDGAIKMEDRLPILQNGVGAAIGMHRAYFIVNTNENFLKSKGFNPMIEDQDDAKYASGLSGIWKWLKGVFFALLDDKSVLNSRTRPQIYNSRRIVGQFVGILTLVLLQDIWINQVVKNKSNYATNVVGYTIQGVKYDEISEYSPLDFLNQIKSVSAGISPFENSINLINPFKFDKTWSNEKIKSGIYKNDSRRKRTIIKAIPGIRGLYESSSTEAIKTKWRYLQTQLDNSTGGSLFDWQSNQSSLSIFDDPEFSFDFDLDQYFDSDLDFENGWNDDMQGWQRNFSR